MKCIGLVLLLVVISAVLSACGSTASPATFTQTSGSLSARLEIIPYPPVPMEQTVLELTLRDADGQPVSGATVRFDLTMPSMEMPANRPEATEGGDGLYRAQAILTMAGEWQILVEVSHPDGNEEFTFHLSTK